MIVRILGEGQLRVDDAAAAQLNELDTQIAAAVDKDDEPAFREALSQVLELVRQSGQRLEPGSLEPSAYIIPAPDATMAEVRQMMTDEGLIPG